MTRYTHVTYPTGVVCTSTHPYGRAPTTEERSRMSKLLKKASQPINQPKEAPMAYPTVKARTTEKLVKKSNADTKFLETTIATQVDLITTLGDKYASMYDTLVDSEHLLKEEGVDDLFSIGELKEEVGEMMKQFNTWKKAQE